MHLTGWLVGLLAHVVFKWAEWKKTSAEPWAAYWKAHAAENIASGVMTVVAFSLWEAGWLTTALTKFAETMGLGGGTGLPVLNVNFLTSMGAAYVVDSMTRRVQSWLSPPPTQPERALEIGEAELDAAIARAVEAKRVVEAKRAEAVALADAAAAAAEKEGGPKP